MAAAAWAEEAAPAPAPDDSQRVAEVQAKALAGDLDGAIADARTMVGKTRDTSAKADVMRILADCLRKKGDWKAASGAYTSLRDCCEKDSDDYVRHDAVAEVLRTSANGVYAPAGTKPTAGDDGKPKTLADDAELEAALARLAACRAARLKTQAGIIRRGRSPQEVAKAFVAAAEEARRVFLLGPETAADDAHALGTTAGQRLQEISLQVQPALRTKLEKWQAKFDRPWSFTNQEKKDIQQSNALCKEMAEAEKQFQESLFYVSGSAVWDEATSLRTDSSARKTAYEQLAEQFIVPKYTTFGVW